MSSSPKFFKKESSVKFLKKEQISHPFNPRKLITVRRIQATRDIPVHGVKAGDIGGYVGCSRNKRNYLIDNAWVTKDALVYDTYLQGNSIVKDSAIVFQEIGLAATFDNTPRFIACNGDVEISENAIIHAHPVTYTNKHGVKSNKLYGAWQPLGPNGPHYSAIRGTVKISGDVYIENPNEISGVVSISGIVNIKSGVAISGTVSIADQAIINEDVNLYNHVTIEDDVILESGNTVDTFKGVPSRIYGKGLVLKNEKVFSVTRCDGAKNMDTGVTVPEVEVLPTNIMLHQATLIAIKEKFVAYQEDIVKLIKYPVMGDVRDENTLLLVKALAVTERIDPALNPDEFNLAVDNLETKFLLAGANAHRLALTTLTDEERKKTEDAQQLLALALDESASDNEKKLALQQGFKRLEGVIIIPDIAKENFKIKAGLLELE